MSKNAELEPSCKCQVLQSPDAVWDGNYKFLFDNIPTPTAYVLERGLSFVRLPYKGWKDITRVIAWTVGNI